MLSLNPNSHCLYLKWKYNIESIYALTKHSRQFVSVFLRFRYKILLSILGRINNNTKQYNHIYLSKNTEQIYIGKAKSCFLERKDSSADMIRSGSDTVWSIFDLTGKRQIYRAEGNLARKQFSIDIWFAFNEPLYTVVLCSTMLYALKAVR